MGKVILYRKQIKLTRSNYFLFSSAEGLTFGKKKKKLFTRTL